MLTEANLKTYRINILDAAAKAHAAITESQKAARQLACEGCVYCAATMRHKIVLESTLCELLELVHKLKPGMKTTHVFPKQMTHNLNLYRGFITWDGEYVSLPGMEHDAYRARYIEEHGKDRGYQLIAVHSSCLRNEVQFTDRKLPPTSAQYATLRELLIDAEGMLSFRFMYNTNHPSVIRHLV